jgi:hypothetical protein
MFPLQSSVVGVIHRRAQTPVHITMSGAGGTRPKDLLRFYQQASRARPRPSCPQCTVMCVTFYNALCALATRELAWDML